MSDPNFKIENGTKVKSKVNGFTGIVVAQAHHMYGCNRYHVSPPVDSDGKVRDGYWCDEDELEIVKENVIPESTHNHGGFPSTKM